MLSASRNRLFNPLLDNPLHTDNDGSGSSLEGSRMLVDDVLTTLRSPDASPKNHMTTNMIADKDSNLPLMKLVPAFLLVPQEQVVEQPPVISFMSGLPQPPICPPPLLSPPRSNLESLTRINLTPLMLSKGIIASPAAAIPPVQTVPQAQELIQIPTQPQYTQQLAPLSFYSMGNTLPTFTLPNTQITIQVAQPLVLQDIGLNDRSGGLEQLGSGESDSGATPASENYIMDTENVGNTEVLPKQPKKHNYTPNTQKKGGNSSQRLKTELSNPINAKFEIIKWKNALTRFWYLLERGGYNEKEHHKLISLLSEMNENKNHATMEWLKNTKIAEYLEKFKKENSIFDYDPLVREVTSSILEFWNKRFPLS